MKKVISILACCLMLFGVFALIGCNNECDTDLAPILYRLDAVEQHLLTLQNGGNGSSQEIQGLLTEVARLEGLIEGLTTNTGNHTTAITNIQSALTALRDDLTALQTKVDNLPTAPVFRIHDLGDTFYYYNHGMRLFSIQVNPSDISPATSITITITNYNMPGFAPHNFLRARRGNLDGNFSTLLEFGAFPTPLPIGMYREFGAVREHQYLWFGTPVETNSMIPFVKFRIS